MTNEKRLIDANALSEKIGNMKFEITRNRGGYQYCTEDEKNEWDKLDSFDSLVCDAPTVDAVEVVHGRWITWQELFPKRFSLLSLEKNKGFCSRCGAFRKKDNFCPNCGAKMDGGV